MVTVRLPNELENKLKNYSKYFEKTKTDIIKEALHLYFKTKEEQQKTSFELGKDLFGKYGSSDGSLSQNYKRKLREKLYEKYNTRR